MKNPLYPSLYQINTRVWLTGLSQKLGRPATLDDIPDGEIEQLAVMGFDWIWLLSVWTTGSIGRKISRENPEWRHDFEATLPDLNEEDIAGSGFAVADYTVHPALGGNEALIRLRARLKEHGLKLMLDFVPNHMGPDHPWVTFHPDYFVTGKAKDLEQAPQNYTSITSSKGELVFAYGRDLYFSGWPDTVQLDYSNPATVKAMQEELIRISGQCDGVRCDMAMLILPEVFEKTWGHKAHSFWPEAIMAVRESTPGFCFMAEVYWDMEWVLMEQGFDYAYDKTLYDRLGEGHARAVREHFYAGPDYQDKLARFLENHDEKRASAAFDPLKHGAAAIITFLSPGLRFFHQGQFEGRKKRISPHLVRAPRESPDLNMQMFYSQLLAVLHKPLFRNGQWRLLKCIPAWDRNETWDSFLAFSWEGADGELALVVVNYAPYRGQCLVALPFSGLTGRTVRLCDMMSPAMYERDGRELASQGLFLDLPAWGYHVFEVLT